MSDNFSTGFPRPPDLQPIPSPQNKLWQILSLVLIVSGLVLLVAGGWMFYQYQLEASKPPPARILEVSVPDETDTPLPLPSPSSTLPVAIPTDPPVEAVAEVPEPSPTVLSPTASPVPSSDIPPVADLLSAPDPAPRITVEPTFTPIPTATPSLLPAPVETSTPAGSLSLAENPLVVAEEELPPAPAGAPAAPAVLPPTRVVAESIGLDASVVEVGWEQVIQSGMAVNVWSVADYAAGWHKNTALPGQGGNVVLSGHHNIKGEVFRYIIEMNIGDVITLYAGDQPFQYVVVDKFIVKDKDEPEAVRRENAKWIGPFNEERLTLVTCWPYTNNTHRAIVIARPVTVVQGTPAN